MRFATALVILVLLAGSAFADPSAIEPKPWEHQLGPPRDVYPEAEPNNTCPGQAYVIGDVVQPAALSPAGDLDWYSFAANAGEVLTIGTDSYNGSSTDTYIELYFQCGGTMLAYDDDSGPGLFSLIAAYTVPQTGTYNVKVRGYSSSTVGEYKFFVTVPQPPPPNDVCGGAIVIERCTQASLTGDLAPYTNNYDPGSGGCADGYPEAGKDETYKVDLLTGDILDMTYTQLSADAAFYVVTDCANVPGTCVAGADATFSGQPEVISYTATADGTYYIILDCYGTNTGGAWTWTYTITCPGPPEGACCIDTVCVITTEAGCQGTWQGAGTDCDPNPCVPVPVEESSWGHIKANYR
jgi:hypothetical protein